MIEQLKGTIIHSGQSHVVLSVGGVGYKVFVTPGTLSKLNVNDEVELWTHMAVRENSLDLYGFTQRSDMKFFELLLSISGIGPKSALGVLSVADTDILINAISTGDTSYLTKVSGIGKKSAERIVIELKDKVVTTGNATNMQEDLDAMDALVSMGYTASAVREVLKTLPGTIVSVNAKVKEALKLLSNNT